MKKVIIIIFLTTILSSCDYFNDTKICKTRNEITLKITFDAGVVKGWSGGMLAENIDKTFNK